MSVEDVVECVCSWYRAMEKACWMYVQVCLQMDMGLWVSGGGGARGKGELVSTGMLV